MKKSLSITGLLVVAVVSLFSPQASADALADALTECRQQQNALKRLVCYDEISLTNATTPPAKAAAASSTVKAHVQPAPAATMPATKTPVADENFGLEHKKTTEKQADQLYLTVSSISYSPRKELIVEFDNGQIWRQSGSGYYKIAVGERHYIKRGMFNSFSLGHDDTNRTIKVRRVQ